MAAIPEELGGILDRYLRQSGLGEVLSSNELVMCWREAVGGSFSEHTRLLGIRNQVLKVEVDCSPRLQELDCFLKGGILQHLQQNYKRRFIKDISFTLGSF